MYFNKFQFRLEEIIEKNGGRPTRSLIFSGRAGEIEGHLAFSWPQKKLVTQYSFTNFFIAKRRDRVQERGTRTTFSKMKKSRFRQKEVHVPTRNGGHELFQRE